MNGTAQHASPQWLPALDLAAVVRRHAAGFAHVRACGDWSEQRFRQFAGPVLLAFARHAHLLPAARGEAPGSLLDAGIDACAQAVLAEAARESHASRIERQEAVVLRVLSYWTAAAVMRWRVSTRQGRPVVLAERPLADQLHEAEPDARHAVSEASCLIEAVAAGEYTPGAGDPIDAAGAGACVTGMVLLLRAVPPAAMVRACTPSPSLIVSLIHHALGQPPASECMQGMNAGLATPLSASSLRGAMHALVAEGRWKVNVRRARLWHLDGRLYLAWKTASTELAERLLHDPAAVLAALASHGIVLPACAASPGGDPATALRTIRTPHTESLPVLELADAATWLRLAARHGA